MRNLQTQLVQYERKYEQKIKEMERLNDSQSKLKDTLAAQQLELSQSKQRETETKKNLSAEIKQLQAAKKDLESNLNSCRSEVSSSTVESWVYLAVHTCTRPAYWYIFTLFYLSMHSKVHPFIRALGRAGS